MEISGYRVGESLSHTTRHAVHRARHLDSGRDVVLKRAARDYPLAEDVLRLELERRLLERLRGPGIVELVGVEQLAGSPVLVLEDFAAQSLADLALPLDLEQFSRVAPRLVAALARVHAAQVIHKDLKPSNVLWNAQTNTLKLIDFQLSAVVSRERGELKVGEQLEGSLAYLSPEQTGRMNRSLDYRSDYYSLGVTFFELLTGQLPFHATDAMGWVHCHLSKIPPLANELNPAVPRPLALLVAKLLRKEPSERYQGSPGLLADLERCRAASAAGNDEPVLLGADDISERFSVSQRLVGRARELTLLQRAFSRARSGRARLLLVSGYAGVGKSSVIREALEPICATGGWSCTGKFDQLERGVPYAALALAFRDLLRQVLAESEPRVEAYRQRVIELVGSGLSQLVEFLPELGQLVGPQPPSEKVEGPYAQRRFQQAFARLARALATAEAPLVIFLDDLQWTDPSTPDLLIELLCHGEPQHLLVIGAFRDNEVHDNHLLALALQQLRELAPELIDDLQLAPLTPTALNELVSDTLRSSPERCAALAAALFEKSQGNPFFTGELLEALHRQGAICFDSERGRWGWDWDAVRAASATANVVELMVRRLGTLSEGTRAVLKIAACLGNTFSVAAIAELLGTDPPSVMQALSEPAREGLILPLTSNVRFLELAGELAAQQSWDARFGFQHDRVQEAAYSLTSAEERAQIHLRIGRTSLARSETGAASEDRFATTNHLNLARALITDLREREQLARLNHEAAAKAFATTSFALAARYHDAAAACLSPEEWAERPELRFQLFSERVSSVLLAGERQRAEQLCTELFEWAPSKAERGRVFLARCEVLVYQADLPAAVEAVRQGLALLGFDFPADPEAIQAAIGQGIGKMQAHLARVPVERLHELPDVTDPEIAVALELLYHVVPAAIMIYPPLFVLAELLMFDAALTHGLSPFCAKNFVDCGMIQGQFLGDFDRAYGLGKAAFRVLDRYGTRALASPVHFVFAAFVSSWRAPHAESLASCRLGMKLAAETGNLLYLGYFNVLHPRLLLLMGRPLSECLAEGHLALSLVDRTRGSMQSLGVRLCNRALARLSGPTLTRQASELADAALEEEIRASGNQQWVYQYGQAQMFASVLLGDWQRAEYWSAFTRESLLSATTNQTVPEYHLLECLLVARVRWPRADQSERPRLIADCQARVVQLRGWAQGCPENHAQLCALAEASLATLCDEPMDRVLAHYERAADESSASLLHVSALARELQSAYLRDEGFASLADAPLERAYELYAHWGAAAKVALLEAEHPRLFGKTAQASARSTLSVAPRPQPTDLTGPVPASALDNGSVMKAVRAISSEVKPERLYARLMEAMLENAAAQRGFLLLAEESSERLLVRARADGDAAPTLCATALDEEAQLCASAVRAVARSGEVLVLDDAQSDPRFGRDRHVRARGVKSVLCVPVLHQGQVKGVLYLENNATTHAFTAARVEALHVIAGQAAISIANAELYAHLERRVQERTRELAAKTRKIEAILQGLQQGVFTIDPELRIQSEYSGHLAHLLGTDDLVGRPLAELLFAGARLSADAIERNAGALLFAFGSRRLLADANERHLIREFTRVQPDGSEQLLEVDWNWVIGEDETVASVLVTLRDVTLVRGLAHQVARAEREARIVAQLLAAGATEFSAFRDSARRSLDRDRERLADARELRAADLPALFRSVHTIKGNARALGLSEIADAAHAAEDGLARLKERDDSHTRAAALSTSTRLGELLEDYERTGREKLAPLWAQRDSGLSQAMAAVEGALSRSAEGTLQPLQLISELEQIVQRRHVLPLEQLLEKASRSLPSLAEELGRAAPELDFPARGWTLVEDWAAPLESALTHAFRNALDHGIEPIEQRILAGKQPRGRIQLRVERSEFAVQLRLCDDGRGLALDRLRARHAQRSLSDAELAEAVFAFGVSSAPELSSISGRGVGLDALRSELRQRGGDAFIEFTASARDGYRPFQLVLRLPNAAFLPRIAPAPRARGDARRSEPPHA